MGYGVIEFAAAQLLVSSLFTAFYGWKGRRILKINGSLPIGNLTRRDIKMITKNGFGYLMLPIWQSIYFQGSTFVVRLALGAEAVAVFNTVRTLSRSINQMYGIINSSIFPEIQVEIGAGNITKAKKILMQAMKVTAGIAVIG